MTTHSTPYDDKLLELLDGTLPEADRIELERMLVSSGELRARLEELRNVDSMLINAKVVSPSADFTSKVLSRLRAYQTSSRTGLLLLAGIIVVITLATLLVSLGVFDAQGAIDLRPIGFNNEYLKLPSVPVNGNFIVNGIIALNVVLALVVLDRTILRPWFDRRHHRTSS